MYQEPGTHQETEHLLAQVIAPIQPPVFTHADIAAQYQEGCYTTRLEAELEDILRSCSTMEQAPASLPLSLLREDDLARLQHCNCIALLQHGQVLPLLDIDEQMLTPPITLQQRVQFYHAAARTLLEAIAAIYEDQLEQRQQTQSDDNEDGCCFVS